MTFIQLLWHFHLGAIVNWNSCSFYLYILIKCSTDQVITCLFRFLFCFLHLQWENEPFSLSKLFKVLNWLSPLTNNVYSFFSAFFSWGAVVNWSLWSLCLSIFESSAQMTRLSLLTNDINLFSLSFSFGAHCTLKLFFYLSPYFNQVPNWPGYYRWPMMSIHFSFLTYCKMSPSVSQNYIKYSTK